jgi:hypothetical protein
MNLMHRVDTFLGTLIGKLDDLPESLIGYEREVIELLWPVFYKGKGDVPFYCIQTPEIHSVGETDLKNASRGTFSVVGTSYAIEYIGLLAVLVIDSKKKTFRAVSKGAYNLAELADVTAFYDKNISTRKQLLQFTDSHDLAKTSPADKKQIADDFATFLENCETARKTKISIIGDAEYKRIEDSRQAEFIRMYNRDPSLMERLIPPPKHDRGLNNFHRYDDDHHV